MTKEQATIEYHELICGALDTMRMEGEVHHIVPRSCGGLDCDTNLVRLTCQEHYKAHELLPFIYDKGREHRAMVFAWNVLSKRGSVSEEQFAVLRKQLKESNRLIAMGRVCSDDTKRKISEAMKGRPSPNKGRKASTETRAKMSSSHKGVTRRKWTDEQRKAQSERFKLYYKQGRLTNSMKGKHHSETTKNRISSSLSGRKHTRRCD